MNLSYLIIVVCVACLLSACYMGAGIVMFPPNMIGMEVFPEQFGLRYERVSFKTGDGLSLSGWFLPSPNGSRATVLMCHGWGDNKGHLLKFTHFLNAAGFNLLYFDFRSHGESEGEMTTLGYNEIVDFDAAIRFLKGTRPELCEKLGVFGFSMGAAVAAMAVPSHPEIKCAVLESPFTDYKQVIRQWAWNSFHVPNFPLISITLFILRLRVGNKDVDTYSPIRFIGKIAPRPLLFIAGANDELMREKNVRTLYAAAGDPKQLWVIPGAAHGQCAETAGLEYEMRLANFLKRHLS